ncbi:probable adenylate kinase 7, mitochondrial isoform X2 [Tripterygium wilfordii]|uniref:probable adenylate kinase 7, mitochondrial isoform X2 n=1 Tax=Tripterygium wilfordii TaxID=458696 RepID=UPI0018F82BCE|nr:probable adenylate kinase 7, mitochondrial isoform X2 [Tripterygium wilfordii]
MKPLLSIFSFTALNSLTMVSSPVRHIFRLNPRRFRSVAAALPEIIDPDFYDDNCNKSQGNLLGPAPMADTEGSAPRRGVQWAFIGSPRSKRSVYAVALSKFLKIPRISMGCLVRQELGPSSSLYKQIADAVNCGEIVSEDIILGLLSKRLDDGYSRGETGFILDGVPRSQIQAEILDQLAEIDLVVNFRCTENFLVKHLGEIDWKEELQAYAEKFSEQATGRLL